MSITIRILILGSAAVAFSTPSGAALKVNEVAGESKVEHPVPNAAPPEVCVVPKHFPLGKYAGKDIEREAGLCALDIGVNAAACAKLNSTNPGVLFEMPPKGVALDAFIAGQCKPDGKTEAKYKLSTSCSYTPSLLAYYHLSRVLGNIVNVPVAVVRTLDLDRHKAVAQHALHSLKSGELIFQTWAHLNSLLQKRSSDLIFVDGFKQTYGALQKNPRGEQKYKEFFNGSGAAGPAAFRDKNPIYKSLTNPVLAASRTLSQASLQQMVQLKDAGDFILLDTILGQQDRFGNIHSEMAFYYPTQNKAGEFKLKSEKDPKDVPAEAQAKVMAVKEMILKDNDCGVAKDGLVKQAKLLDRVAHMDPSTYANLMAFAKVADQPENKDLFIHGMLFSEKDYAKVMGNLREAVNLLKDRCTKGQLKLDLDLDLHFSGNPLPKADNCNP